MRDTKYALTNFMLYDYANVEEYLIKQAKKGWRLTKITNYYWKFQRAEPADVSCAVTYVPEASRFDPEPTREEQGLVDYCQEAGWKKAADWDQMQVFYHESPDAVPIETDEEMRFEIVKASMGKNTWAYWTIIALYTLLLGMDISDMIKSPVEYLASSHKMLTVLVLFYAVLLFVHMLGKYYYWVKKSGQSLENGGECIRFRKRKWMSWLQWGILVLILGSYVLFSESMTRNIWLVMMIGMILIFILTESLRKLLKRLRASKEVNKFLVATAYIVVYLMLAGGLTAAVIKFDLFTEKPAETYMASDWEWEIYKDEIPLKIEDLRETDYEHYSYEKEAEASLFLKKTECVQRSFPDGLEAYDLSYRILEVRLPGLYSWMFEETLEYLDRYDDENLYDYLEADAEPWNAEIVFRRCDSRSGKTNTWVIGVEQRIIILRTDWELTEEQIEIIAEKLY